MVSTSIERRTPRDHDSTYTADTLSASRVQLYGTEMLQSVSLVLSISHFREASLHPVRKVS